MTDITARLEPFLLIARSPKGAAAAKVVLDATATPGVYVFAELLDVPNIRELATDLSFVKHVKLLELFAYGTLADYLRDTALYPPLTPTHILKLKHLTLVSIALQHRSIPYDQLLSSLDLISIRELEDLIIDVIYAGLLGGKMHHYEKVFHVDWVAGRDVRIDDLANVRAGLENWCQTASTLLSALDQQITHLRQTAHSKAQSETAYNNRRDQLYGEVAAQMQAQEGKKTTRGKGNDFSGMGNSGRMGNRTRGVGVPDDLVGVRSPKRSR